MEKPRLMVDMSFDILRNERSMAVTRGEVDVVVTFWHVTLLHPQGPMVVFELLPEFVPVAIQSLMFEDLKDRLDC